MAEKTIKTGNLFAVKLVFLVLFAALFAADVWFVCSGRSAVFDDSVLAFFIGLRGEALTMFFRVITFCGDQATVIIICVVIIALPRRTIVGLPAALMTGIGAAVQSLIKSIVDRPRPAAEFWLIGETDWMGFPLGTSFPSGHANSSMIFWMALAILVGRIFASKGKPAAAVSLRIIFFIFAFLIGVSRLYLGVHFFTDVFGGWMLSGILLIVFIMLYDRFWPAGRRAGYKGAASCAAPLRG